MGSLILDYATELGAFLKAFGTSGWTIGGAVVSAIGGIGQAEKWWKKHRLPYLQLILIVKRFCQWLRWRVIAIGCFLVAAFLSWSSEASARKKAETTIAADQFIITSQSAQIARLNELLHKKREASDRIAVTSNNQLGGITTGVLNVGAVDRVVSVDQQQQIIRAVKGKVTSPIYFIFENSAPDGVQFASGMLNALGTAGLNVMPRDARFTSGSPAVRGVWVFSNKPSSETSTLIEALRAGGIRVQPGRPEGWTMGAPTNIPAGAIAIWVGQRE
jgi:hypothetical protein